jgi:nucleotide-binding universal stress UspA family protein
VPGDRHAKRGAPAERITAATDPGDLVVLTSRGRGGVTRWLLGSVAERLIRSGPVRVVLAPDATGAEGAASVPE